MGDEVRADFPMYGIDDLYPEQVNTIRRLGNLPIVGSHGTAIFLADPARGIRPPHLQTADTGDVATMGSPHAVTYTCPVVMVAGQPRMVLPTGETEDVRPEGIGPVLEHWKEG